MGVTIAPEEAAVAEIKKGARITGVSREKLAAQVTKKYEGGASIRELAESTGRSYGFVHRLLRESGATMRGRGGATRGRAATGGNVKASAARRSTGAGGKATAARATLHSVK